MTEQIKKNVLTKFDMFSKKPKQKLFYVVHVMAYSFFLIPSS